MIASAAARPIYRHEIVSAIPAGITDSAAKAIKDSLATAAAAAAQLPGRLGSELLASARAAFTNGLHAAAAISAALLFGVAVVVVITLRHLRPLGQEASAAGAPDEAGT